MRITPKKFWTVEQLDFVSEFRWRWNHALGDSVECPDDNQLFKWSACAGFDGPVVEAALAAFAYRLKNVVSPIQTPYRFFSSVLARMCDEQRREAA